MLKVMLGEPWPRRRLMVTMSRPAAIRALAWVCRKAWKVTRGRRLPATASRHCLLSRSGERGGAVLPAQHEIFRAGAADAER